MKLRFTEDDDLDTMDLSKAMSMVKEQIQNPQAEKEQEMETEEPTKKKKVKRKIVKKAKVKKAAAKKPAATKRAAAPRTDGAIDLQMLAKETKLEPTILRRRIRAMEGLSKKKAHRYVWEKGDSDLKKIRANLSA